MLITLELLNIKTNFKQQIIRGLTAFSDYVIRFDLELNFQGQISEIWNFIFSNAFNSLTIEDTGLAS